MLAYEWPQILDVNRWWWSILIYKTHQHFPPPRLRCPRPQWKKYPGQSGVLKGKILDVVVDIRKSSKYYGKSFSIELDDLSNKQLFVPKGFAHGFLVLSDIARVSYKVDNYYKPNFEMGLIFNDPLLKIDWKIEEKSIIINNKEWNSTNTFFPTGIIWNLYIINYILTFWEYIFWKYWISSPFYFLAMV